MPVTIESIGDDLERCRNAKRLPKVFGAEAHRFELYPVVRKSVVGSFESKHGIQLPDDYRRFITEVGNGGPEAGNVWEDLRTDQEGLRPTKLKRKRRATFLEWYNDWLQRAVSKLS